MAPRIFYWAYAHNNPSGGQKQMYRHVDILRHAGHEAYLVHFTEGFRITWFANSTSVIGPGEFRRLIRPDDFVVLPEDLGQKLLCFPGRKIIFNQNLYFGFNALVGSESTSDLPFTHPDVCAMFVVSEHNQRCLRFAYPNLRLMRVKYGVDSNKFQFVPLSRKLRKIVTIRKGGSVMDVEAIFRIVTSRAISGQNSCLSSFEWVFLKDMSELEVQKILGEALMFVFLSFHEGLPILPLEAMSSGCLLAVHDAGPLREYIPEPYRFGVGDLPSIVSFIEKVTSAYPDNLREFEPLAAAGRAVAAEYSTESEAINVLEIWDSLLGVQQGCSALFAQ